MDSYLNLAVSVLKEERRPLSARAILSSAYRRGLVPPQLYGATQHKTLQAGISEDIVARREHSLFFRTEPGRFFLREFLADTSLPEEFRRPVPTRRRVRELDRGPALAFDRSVLYGAMTESSATRTEAILQLLRADLHRYEDPKHCPINTVFVRAFVCVLKNTKVLSYRLGRYRDERETFLSRRCIGFSSLVHPEDHTLFDRGDYGITDSGIRAIHIDLEIPQAPTRIAENGIGSLEFFVWACGARPRTDDLLAVVKYECPPWFEPTKRRLALNDMAWLDLRHPVNDPEDFDPWSKAVLLNYYYQSQSGFYAQRALQSEVSR